MIKYLLDYLHYGLPYKEQGDRLVWNTQSMTHLTYSKSCIKIPMTHHPLRLRDDVAVIPRVE